MRDVHETHTHTHDTCTWHKMYPNTHMSLSRRQTQAHTGNQEEALLPTYRMTHAVTSTMTPPQRHDDGWPRHNTQPCVWRTPYTCYVHARLEKTTAAPRTPEHARAERLCRQPKAGPQPQPTHVRSSLKDCHGKPTVALPPFFSPLPSLQGAADARRRLLCAPHGSQVIRPPHGQW